MISSASTLLLATLVFNAASVLGAPVRIPVVSEVVARAEVNEPVLPRIDIVDVQPQHSRSPPGPVNRRGDRLPRETENDIRDTASSDTLETRHPLPEVEKITRRYPRRALHDFYERRSEPLSHPAPREPAKEPQEVKRRYPRRVYHDYFERRSEPAQPEAREEPSQLQERRYPRRVYAEYYEKRSSPDPVPRSPTPDQPEQLRRFPRSVYAEHYEKRQSEGDGDPAETPADKPAPSPVVPSGTAAASSSATSSTSPPAAAAPTPPAPIIPSTHPVDVNAIVQNVTAHNGNSGFQPGTTIKETTVVINKVTHVSDTKGPANAVPQCNSAPSPSSSSATPSSSSAGTPTSTTASSSTTSSSAPTGTSTPPAGSTTPTGGDGGDDPAAASPSPSASSTSTSDEAKPTGEAPEGEGGAAAAGGSTEGGDATTRRSLANDKGSSQPIARRALGFSGAAWASLVRRSAT